ncbi:MAG: T9SS type A sorting domain-containing protein [Candidatus Marinimicrobia bacterium]|nr:T9SS type A sorting domain-containing protein [Candidatus Neomarinimicrobiota bacterium]
MRKLGLSTIILLLFVSALSAYSLNWAKYDFIDPANDISRGLAYSYDTDHIYVATRLNNEARVVVLDPETGSQIGMLDTTATGFQGGTYRLNQVSVADDGVIYVCNLSVPSVNADDHFKVYRYKTEDSAPELIFDDAMSGMRFGDSFQASGEGDNTYIYSSGYQNDQMVVLHVTNRQTTMDRLVQLPSINSARQGISVVSPNGNLWINGVGDSYPPARLIGPNGNIIAEVPDSLMSPGGSSAVLHWSVGRLNLLTCTNAFLTNSLRSVRYEEDELGTVSFDYLGWNSDSLMLAYQGTTLNNNLNGSCALAYDSTRHALYTLMGVNSIASVNLNTLLQVATPRDTGWFAVQIDGKNDEYTHYDFLDEDNYSKLYFTWSNDMVFAGLTGSTLYAPYQERGLFLAFDTDPDGGEGSNTMPVDASSIAQLPFNADVIVQFESDDYADLATAGSEDKWTTGYLYKWNGSQWNASEITGFDINYGAMAIIGDGNDTLITEIGVARNPIGLGSDITKINVKVFLSEIDPGGQVLKVFPNNGENGGSPVFTTYYQFEDMGDDVLPAMSVKRIGAPNSIDDTAENVAETFELQQNYPNPFNPTTTIEFQTVKRGNVELSVYNLSGQLVGKQMFGNTEAGYHQFHFDGANLSSGVYFYKVDFNGQTVGMKKMALLK